MNISSVVITLKDGSDKEFVLSHLAEFYGIEVIASQDDKIVAVVSADDVSAEVGIFKQVEMINGVANVAMVYAYQEDIEFDRDKLELKNDISEILTNDDIKAENICYNGSVHYKVK